MAALLLIERDKTEKVVNFLNECRRMGISVLPPDVNYSGLDFEIQDLPDEIESVKGDPMIAYRFPVPEGSAIRFGMAAVKMVGEGPVQMILDARKEGGRFKSLEDFADRVDLRKVGKRPLECLIKVGAFDRFGKRSQLLAVLDQMVANSASVHDARASGQLSMFDLLGGGDAASSVSAINLPKMDEVKGREKLMWEKELLGVYAASHPMQNLGIDLSKVVTCYCNELSEEHHDKNVVLAGMITSVRVINTKKGDQMAFVNLEDLQGQCEVVVFPRTYAEIKEQLVPDTVVVMKGKAQTREGQTNLLVDSIQNYVEQAAAGGEEPHQYQQPLIAAVPTLNGLAVEPNSAEEGDDGDADFVIMGDGAAELTDTEENPFAGEMPAWMADAPPPPEIVTTQQSVVAAHEEKSPTGTHANGVHQNGVHQNGTHSHEQGIAPERSDTPIEDEVNVAVVDALSDGSDQVVPSETVDQVSSPAVVGAVEQGTNGVVAEASIAYDVAESPPATKANAIQPTTNGKRLNVSGSLAGLAASAPAETARAVPVANRNDRGSSSEDASTEKPSEAGNTALSDDSEQVQQNGQHRSNGQTSNGYNGNGHAHRNGAHLPHVNGRQIRITFRRSGDLDRDKFRLKEIFERVRDPRGRDQFFIVLETNGKRYELAFPNDPCTISERLVNELTKHFRVDVAVDGE
ncbi:MAG: OB-fold nucleic acid binding domain-containing protein [Caldilineaceae bacterium]